MRSIRVMVLSPLLVLFSVFPAKSQCNIQFSGADGTVYNKIDLGKFVEEQVRPRLSTVSRSFQITINAQCAQDPLRKVVVTIDDIDFYVTDIQTHHLSQAEITYQSSPLTLSATNFDTEIINAYNIDNLRLPQIQTVVKTLAFFFAETARFSDIENIADTLVKGCTAEWLDYEKVLRRWSRISKLALHENNDQWTVRGGKTDELIAPITSQAIQGYNAAILAGDNGPDASYVDPRDWNTSISVPGPSCAADAPNTNSRRP
jgi:hypothetical protein